MGAMDTALKSEIQLLVAELVRGHYASVASNGRGSRLSENDLREAMSTYGRTLILLPSGWWDLVNEFPREDNPEIVAIDVPLWTKEEGRSDLTLCLTVIKSGSRYLVNVDDLRVL